MLHRNEIQAVIHNLNSLIWITPLGYLLLAWLVNLLLTALCKTAKRAFLIQLVSVAGLAGALCQTYLLLQRLTQGSLILFNGLLQVDSLTLHAQLLLLVIALLLLYLFNRTSSTGEQTSQFYPMRVLGIVIGAYGLSMANHWLMVYLTVTWITLASLPLLISSQPITLPKKVAARQYLLYSMVAHACMLWGLSYAYGITKSLQVDSDFYKSFASMPWMGWCVGYVLPLTGLLMVWGCFPFQFWIIPTYAQLDCGDAACWSILPKIAVCTFLIRLQRALYPFLSTPGEQLDTLTTPYFIWAILAGITLLIGHLAALRAKDAKQILAAGSIGHIGLISTLFVIPMVPTASISYYIIIYSLTHMVGWYALYLLNHTTKSFSLTSYAGLGHTMPWQAVCYTYCMLGLIGLPPTAGLIAKILVIFPLWESLQQTGSPTILSILLGLVGIGTILSLYYYLLVPYQLFFGKAPHSIPLGTQRKEDLYKLILLTFVLFFLFRYPPTNLLTRVSVSLLQNKLP